MWEGERGGREDWGGREKRENEDVGGGELRGGRGGEGGGNTWENAANNVPMGEESEGETAPQHHVDSVSCIEVSR